MLSDTNNTEYYAIWNKVCEFLKFKPSCQYRGHSMNVPLPFQINQKYAVYAIDAIYESDELIDMTTEAIRTIFLAITTEKQKIYAIDWQHSAFLFCPRNSAEFPDCIPDGDYLFLIEENFQFGYLGHPWRQEIWVWGENFIQKTEKIYQSLSWNKII